ncbi:MAG: hypothetical protein QXS27_01775 [Candidatus Jordarchaeaceae archaeon]
MAQGDHSDSDRLLNESRELVRRALLSVEELKAVMDELNRDLELSKIGLVVFQLSFETKNLVEELLNGLDLPVLVEKLNKEEDLEVIRKFFSYLGQGSKGLPSSWVPEWLADNMNKESLLNKLNNYTGNFTDPILFLEALGSVNKTVARELALKMDWSTIIEKLSTGEDLSSLALCLRCLLEIDPLLVEDFVKKLDRQKIALTVEREKNTKDLEDILLCVFVVRREGVAYDFVWSIIKAGVSNLLKKDLKEIKLFLTRIAGNELLRLFSYDGIDDREEIISVLLECMGSDNLALKVNGETNELLVEFLLRKIAKVNPVLAMDLKEKVALKYQKYLEDVVDSTETF